MSQHAISRPDIDYWVRSAGELNRYYNYITDNNCTADFIYKPDMESLKMYKLLPTQLTLII